MSSNLRHPEDFSSYLDRDFSDQRYEEIRAHLEICPKCREELEIWRNIDAAFRSPELELEVPPFLWQRIASRINGPSVPRGWRVWTAGFGLTRGSLISRAALALGTVLAITWAGNRIVRYRADAQIRAMITHSQPEWKAENPFERLVDDDTEENPFQKVLSSGPRKALRN
jgi:anti-sigma factor RsiW